jgi:hypothetical protein
MEKSLDFIIGRLANRQPPPSLTVRQAWDSGLDADIAALEWAGAAKRRIIALKAGLHLLNDSLDASHAYAQQIEDDSTGAYWHGLIHRMEQDYWNGKYWFRQAGDHPVKSEVRREISQWLNREADFGSLREGRIKNELRRYRDQFGWDCDSFSDLIEAQEIGQDSPETRVVLERLQYIELKTLLRYTRDAVAL